MRFALLLAAIILLATPSWAAAAAYFEFNPDYAQSLLVASSETVLEIFLPLNDHMSGIDFWVSNGGAAGDVTFVLLNQSGAQLSQRTLSLSPIADDSGGTRTHVNWGQFQVTAASAYQVRITTSVPGLRLYYATSNSIIPHNAPPEAFYSSGVASIGGEEREFSFKYALYENSETVPPQLTNIEVQQPAIGQAVVTFNANEPVDAHVDHTTGSVPFTGQYTSCLTGMATCSIHLDVTPGVAHNYTLTARDVWGNETVTTGSFTAIGTPPAGTPTPSAAGTPTPTPTSSSTPTPPPDTSQPTISNLRAVTLSPSSVAIAWTTDEAANSLVVVQTLPFLTSAGGGSDNTFELEHYIAVGGLDPSSFYFTRVTTSDISGNSTTATISFQTLAATPPPSGPTPTPSPTPSAVASPTPTVSVGPGGGSGEQIAQWSPPAGGPPADGYRIDIIGPDGKLVRSIRTKDTSVNLGELPEGATVIVYGDNGGVFEKVAAPTEIKKDSSRGLWPYLLGGLLAAVAGGLVFRRYRAKRRPPAPLVNIPQNPVSGAQPNPSAF